MATNKWIAPEALTTIFSTDLNSLGNGAYSAASIAIDNATGLYLYISLELVLASLTPTTGGSVSVFLLPSLDGSNFEDGGGATAPPAGSVIATWDLSTSTGVKRRIRTNILIPPYQFKLVVLNSAGAALASSGNTLKYARHNEQII